MRARAFRLCLRANRLVIIATTTMQTHTQATCTTHTGHDRRRNFDRLSLAVSYTLHHLHQFRLFVPLLLAVVAMDIRDVALGPGCMHGRRRRRKGCSGRMHGMQLQIANKQCGCRKSHRSSMAEHPVLRSGDVSSTLTDGIRVLAFAVVLVCCSSATLDTSWHTAT